MMDLREYRFAAEVKRVVDGDTLDLVVDLGFTVSVNVRARLARVDTPEKFGVKRDSDEYKEGVRATLFVEQWCDTNGPVFLVQTYKTGKYGRYIAEVWTIDGELNLSDALILQGWGSE